MDRSPWAKSRNISGSRSGEMPRPSSRTRMTMFPLTLGREPDVAPRPGVLRRVGEEVDHNLLQPGRIGVDPQTVWREETISSCSRCSMSRRTDSTAPRRIAVASSRSIRSWILP